MEDPTGVKRNTDKGKVRTKKCFQRNVHYWIISSVTDTPALSDKWFFIATRVVMSEEQMVQ